MWIAACNGDVGALNVLVRANADVNVVSLIFNLHEITLNNFTINFTIWAKSKHAPYVTSYELHPHLTIPANNKQ